MSPAPRGSAAPDPRRADPRRADPRRALGRRGEDLVAAWYEDAGYRILDRNWRCREGELDLVLAGGGTVVFCEVKTRRSTRFGAPVEAVTAAKQRKLRTLALQWLAAHDRRGGDLRFDVASVLIAHDGDPVVEILERAF